MAKDETLQAAVIGVGALGKHHARIYSEMEGIELVGVVDTDFEKAGQIAQSFGCRAFQDYHELPESVRMVSLAVPTVSHAEIAVALLEKGIHVLVEKPMAVTLEEADRMIQAENDSGSVLLVGHSERCNPAFRAAVPFVSKPRFFEGHRLGVFVARSLDVDVILDLMIHDLDLVLWMTDSEIHDIRAVGIPVLTDKVDIANARIEFKNGCVANLTASRVSKERVRKLRFFQPREYLSIDFQEHSVEMFALDLSTGKPGIINRNPEVEKIEPLALEIEEFMQAVRGNRKKTICTSQQGRQSLEVALTIVRQMQVE